VHRCRNIIRSSQSALLDSTGDQRVDGFLYDRRPPGFEESDLFGRDVHANHFVSQLCQAAAGDHST
jgi:hypothetical protein